MKRDSKLYVVSFQASCPWTDHYRNETLRSIEIGISTVYFHRTSTCNFDYDSSYLLRDERLSLCRLPSPSGNDWTTFPAYRLYYRRNTRRVHEMVIVQCQWWNSIRSSVIQSASWFRKYFHSLSVEMIHQYAFQIYRDSDLLHYEIVVLISKVISTTFLWFRRLWICLTRSIKLRLLDTRLIQSRIKFV